MKYDFRWIGIGALALSFVPLSARAQNIEDMLKWQTAKAIHYDVVAAYDGTVHIMETTVPTQAGYATRVTDRFEIGFDWSPTDMSMVGKALLENHPSALPGGTPGWTTAGAQCAGPKISSPYDHVEVLDAKSGPIGTNSLELTATRTFAAGSVTYWNEHGCNNWAETKATSEAVTLTMHVPLGMFMVLPKETLPANTTVKAPDTIIVDDSAKDGWTYTYTLTIAK